MSTQNKDAVNLPLDQIKIPPKEKMPRKITGIDPKVIERYAELMKDGYKGFPPIEVWQKVGLNGGSEWWIVSGIHRYKAALTAGKEIFPCKIRKFPEREFLLRAYIANLEHGVRYKRGENRLVVQQLYQEGLTTKEISNETKIPERTLRRWVKPFADEKRGEREAKAWELRQQGLTQEEIAKEVGMSQRWVSDTLLQLNDSLSFSCKSEKPCDTNLLNNPPSLNIYPEMLSDGDCLNLNHDQPSDQKRDERPGLLNQERTQPAMDAEMPVETGGDDEGGVSNVTAFPVDTAQTGPPGDIQADVNSEAGKVLQTGMADKVKAKADRKFGQPKLRRHLKEAPVEDIRMVYSDSKILRRWRADVKRGAYGKVTLSLMQKCSGTIIRAGNELLLAIRDFKERLEQEPRPAAAGMAEDYREEIQVAVEKFMARNRVKIQWMSEEDREDLKMECLLGALEARQKWDATRSSLDTWIWNNLEWKMKELARKEYARKKTIVEYRKHIEVDMGTNR